MNDDDLLGILRDERGRSIGFENDAELSADRERALNYYKGEMPDVPSIPNRSGAVSTDVADAVETLLPDLVEIFVGGDDVATFVARGAEDEEAARQETDYLNLVIFQQNGGFETFYAFFKDALQARTGVVKYWREPVIEETETFEGKTGDEVVAAIATNEVTDLVKNDDGTYDLTVKRPPTGGRIRTKPIPPEDFTVGADTVRLADATYCAARSRPRAQELVAQGIDADLVDRLVEWSSSQNEGVERARDTAGEGEATTGVGKDGLRTVEVVEHYIRLADEADKGKLKLWRVLTGNDEAILLDKEEVKRIQIAAITPYMVTHRFYGRSVADLLMEVQRIKTALTRGYLDSIYFSLNQRNEVNMADATPETVSDLLNNVPGMPVRSKSGNAIKPITAGGAGFNGPESLEYFSTVGEQRTGIVRNAQGLNPDTLHETAKGAMALMGAAQKRVRLIARIFAETGVKDLFLGVHALLREGTSQAEMVRLRGKWVPVDPSTWGERADMTIEIGVGSGGKLEEQQAIAGEIAIMKDIVELQGGPVGPVVDWNNIYALATRAYSKGGCKAPEAYLQDPNGKPPPPPRPDPEMQKAQAQLQVQHAKNAGELQLQEAKAKGELQIELERIKAKAALEREQMHLEMDLKTRQLQGELALKRELAIREMDMQAASAVAGVAPPGNVSDVQVGGEAG